jgi:flagellar motor component MotA
MVQGASGGGWSSKVEEGVIVGGLLVVQCILAGYVVFVDHVLSLGANPLSLIVLGAVASSLFFLPFAVVLERYSGHHYLF